MEDFTPPIGPQPLGSSHAAHASNGSQENYWMQMNQTYTALGVASGTSGDANPDQVYQYYGQYNDYSNQHGNYYYYQDPYGQHQRSQKQVTCDVCNRSFFSEAKLQKHIEEHVKCPFPECGLEADMKVIDQHITNQHMLVNFEALQMDDEAWIAERKRRFPTAERAAIRRAQQEELFKRGERLQPSKKRFNKDAKTVSKPKSMDKKKTSDEDKRSNAGQNRGQGKRGNVKEENKGRFSRPTPVVDVDPYDSDPEVKQGVPAFKGTKQYYESTGEVSYFVNYTRKVNEEEDLSEEDVEDGLCISDEEEWHSVQTSKNAQATPGETTKIVLSNALGSLIGAYDSDSDDEEEKLENPGSQPDVGNRETVKQSTPTFLPSAPDGAGELVKSGETLNSGENKGRRTRRRQGRRKRPARGKDFENTDAGTTNISRPRPKQPRPLRRRKATLLEKLLEPDIRHERNVILQCIRYIVNSNFFDSSEAAVKDVGDKAADNLNRRNNMESVTRDKLECENRKEKNLDEDNVQPSTTYHLESENDVGDKTGIDKSAAIDQMECENAKGKSRDQNDVETKTKNLLEGENNVGDRTEIDNQNKKNNNESATVDQIEFENRKGKSLDQNDVGVKMKNLLESENNVEDRMEVENRNRKDSLESVTVDQMEYENGKEKNLDHDNVEGKAAKVLKSEDDVGGRTEIGRQNRKNILESGTKDQLKCENKKEKSPDQDNVEAETANLLGSENGIEDRVKVYNYKQNRKDILESSTEDQLEYESRQ